MVLDSSQVLIDYLREEFPGTRVYESTSDCEDWPLMRCFHVKDGRKMHLLVVASKLFATKSDEQLRELLDAWELADCLFRADGAPVVLTEHGLTVVE